MKSIRGVLLGGLALAASLYFVHAQTQLSSEAVQSSNEAQPATPVSEATDDLSVMLQALEQTTPLPASATPTDGGNFYSAQHGTDWPPLPGNTLNLPFWPLGDGFFVLDDRNVDYAALQAAGEAAAAAARTSNTRMSMMASRLSTAYAYGNPVYLTNTAAIPDGYGNTIASFSIAGGTNFVPYDILMTTNLTTPVANWNWLGIGYTSNNYTFYGQSPDYAFYILAKPSKTMVVPWGDDIYGQCDLWTGITNAVQVTGGNEYSLALLSDGTVVGWGYNGATSSELVPTNLVGVTMIASGLEHNVALLTNGTVTAWGDNVWGQINVPAGLTNVTVISAQYLHSLALKSNGTVVAWGYNTSFGETNVPAGLTNVTAIAAGGEHNLVVSNGIVVAWGNNGSGQCSVPAGLSNVWDVAAGWNHSVALTTSGTVVCWGDNSYGESTVPAGLSNVVAIAAGGDFETDTAYTLALKNDGTVVAWGDSDVMDSVEGLNDVITIGGGTDHALAIRTGPLTPVITLAPFDQYQIAGGSVTFASKGVGLYGVTYQWQTNGVNLSGATNADLTLTNVQAAQAGIYNVMVTDNGGMGSLTSPNANLYLVTAPVIVSQTPMPTNQVAIFQTNLTLSVVASAPGQSDGFPLSYQWQFNGTNISGATSTNYSFMANTAGTYSVIVSNVAGSVTASWSVTLTYVGSYIAPGTLAYYLSTNTVAQANGYFPNNSNMLELAGWVSTTYSGTNLAYLTNAVWSTNCWMKGVQGLSATCIGYSNEFSGKFLITMISPRHYLRASHVGSPADLIAFLDTNNVIYWRQTIQQVTVGNDTDVGILNADLPPSVGYLPMIPTNFSNYLPTNSVSYVQGVGVNQNLQWFSQPMTLGNPNMGWGGIGSSAPFGLATNWDYGLVSGDSSCPDILLVSNQFVLASHNYSSISGPNYAYQINAINQQMHYLSTNNAVGTDYQLTQFSLTNWPTIH